MNENDIMVKAENLSMYKNLEIYYYTDNGGDQRVFDVPQNGLIFEDVLSIKKQDNKQIVWYWDSSYTQPVKIGDNFMEHYTALLGVTIVLTFYGRWEEIPVKVLDIEGVKTLYDILSLKDYPNNEVLMAVIDAIDAEKLDKNKLFVGTQEEYDTASQEGTIPEGAIVILTDVN